MVATITTDFTNLTTCDSDDGNWSVTKVGGGGTPGPAWDTGVYLQGSAATGVKVSNQKVFLWYNYITGLNFQPSGGNENQYLYVWVNCLVSGLIVNRAGGGLSICLGQDTSNYYEWYMEGSDTYAGGWIRLVLDPSNTPASTFAGSPSLTSVDYIAITADARPNTLRFDNLMVDRIDVGTKIVAYGTSDNVWQDMIDADEGDSNNKYGIISTKNDIINVNGQVELGDTSVSGSLLYEVDRIIVWENPTYYNGSAEASSVAPGFATLSIKGNTQNATRVEHGVIVGSGDTAKGRNGCTFISTEQPFRVDLDSLDVEYIKTYGCKFSGVDAGLTMSSGINGLNHEFIGNTVDQSGQAELGRVKTRGCIFSGVVASGIGDPGNSAVLWNENIDIKNCSFIANTDTSSDPHAIEHTIIGSYDYTDMIFSGNDYDIEFSSPVSGTLTINATDSDPGTYEITGPLGGTVDIINTVSLDLKIVDEAQANIQDAWCYIEDSSQVELMNEQSIADGTASASYNYGGEESAIVRVRKYGYKYYRANQTIRNNGLDLTITLVTDPQQI